MILTFNSLLFLARKIPKSDFCLSFVSAILKTSDDFSHVCHAASHAALHELQRLLKRLNLVCCPKHIACFSDSTYNPDSLTTLSPPLQWFKCLPACRASDPGGNRQWNRKRRGGGEAARDGWRWGALSSSGKPVVGWQK